MTTVSTVNTVIVERAFPEPMPFEEIQAAEGRSRQRFEARRVRFVRAWSSRDGRRMVCLYEAPGEEAVRLAEEEAGVPFERVWTAHVIRHPGAAPDGDAVVLERLLSEPIDEAGLRDGVGQVTWCLEQWGCRIVSSYLSLDGLRCICVFAAPDAESVRQSQRQAGLPHERAWPATLHEAQPAR